MGLRRLKKTFGYALSLLPLVDEMSMPEVASFDDLLNAPVSCRFQLAAGSQVSVANMFSRARSLQDGEIPAPGWWNEDVPALRAVSLVRVVDGFYFPEFGVVLDATIGGAYCITAQQALYCAPDLTALPFTNSCDGKTLFHPPNALPTIEKAAVTMPWGGLHNYGHFLLDCLSSVVTLLETNRASAYRFVFPPLTSWQRCHLDLLGVEPLEVKSVVRVKDVIYSSCMATFIHNPNVVYRDIRRRQLERFGPVSTGSRRRLYLSRGGNPKRIFLSEEILQQRVVAMGFEILEPEALTVNEQIQAFYDAEAIIGHTGAAFANVLYCSPDTLVVEVQPAGMQNWWVRKLCALMECRHAAYFCDSDTLLAGHPESALRFDFDVNRFVQFLVLLGL